MEKNKLCHICSKEKARQYSTMCQSCIDDGWRFSLMEGGHYKEKPVKRHKCFIDSSRIKVIK